MKLLFLAVKNALFKWWRSLTLGLFVFVVCLSMILFSAFSAGITRKIDTVIADGITGHVQVRSEKSSEGDMVVQQKTGWDDLVFIPTGPLGAAERLLAARFPQAAATHLARQSVFLRGESRREETVLMGIEPARSRYRHAFLLVEGRYLDPDRDDEIMLTREQAAALKFKLGDRVRVTAKNRYGRNTEAFFTLVGIGDFTLLSIFSYKAAYTRAEAVQTLTGLEPDMYTDLIVFLPDPSRAESAARSLAALLKENGVTAIVTRDEKLKTADLKTDALPTKDEYLRNKKLKLSDAGEMGEIFRLTAGIISMFLNALLVLLLIVTSFLIINLVYLTGLERGKEIGTMRAIGFSKARVTFVFMAEVFIITAAGALAALLAGALVIGLTGPAGIAAPTAELAYLMGRSAALEFAPGQVGLIVLLTFGFSLAASFAPAYRAAALDPAVTLRAGS